MFTAGVSSTDDADIDLLMGGKNPGADDLVGGVKKEDTLEKTDPAKGKAEPAKTTTDLEDEDLLLGGPDSTEDDGTKVDPLDKTKTKTDTTKKVDTKKASIPDNLDVDYQAIYSKMVEEGVWEEVDVPEGTEWNKDTFLQVQKLQAEAKYDDLLSKTGTYGKAIIEFEKNGGNPAEMLNLFREQKDIKDYDVSAPEGQEEFLEAYYASQGYSEKSIERTLRSLRDQGGDILKEEAEEKKTIWSNQYNEEIKGLQQEQALAAKELETQQRKFQSTMQETITKDEEVTPKERRELQSYILDYSQNFRGQKVSQFYLDMAEIQKDPKNYVELAKFVKGIKSGEYTKKIVDKTKKEASAQSFLKIKNGSSLTSNSGNPDLEKSSSSNFITMLNRK